MPLKFKLLVHLYNCLCLGCCVGGLTPAVCVCVCVLPNEGYKHQLTFSSLKSRVLPGSSSSCKLTIVVIDFRCTCYKQQNSQSFPSLTVFSKAHMSDRVFCMYRTHHCQTPGRWSRAAPQWRYWSGIVATGRQRRHGHHLQQSPQDGQHVVHQHRLRPVWEESLPRPAHQYDQKQSRHVSARPGETIGHCCVQMEWWQ